MLHYMEHNLSDNKRVHRRPQPIIGNLVRYHMLDGGHFSGRGMRLLVMGPGLRFKFKLASLCLGIQELKKQGRPQGK